MTERDNAQASGTEAAPSALGVASDLFRLDGQVALVTGASSGIGARFAQVLAGAGASVVLAARREQPLRAVAEECPSSQAIVCDVTRDDDRRRLVEGALDRFGRIDVLVNNAGLSRVVPATDEDVDDFSSVVGLNLTATFALSQLVGAQMLAAGGGSIVNVASVYGLVASGSLPQAAYAASKGGVVNLTRELSAQWASGSVRVNALCPGWFRSEMTASMLDDDKGLAWITRRTPMRRVGEPNELDGALLFLAGRASSFVTGINLPVDGGYLAI
ncbi:SDR family NAD(P)-dependent oxidoreductase [Streptomyces sp. NPDC020883]|uniref:SDR family NAD(P)-dependent oxidoreductase n=1 Tax=Streptomyces sp. NPDC020883 TaxID=3365099 RepID=UPI00378F6B19